MRYEHAGAGVSARLSLAVMIIIMTAVMMTGCAGSATWKPVNGDRPQYTGRLGFTAVLPARWLMFEDKPTRSVLLTRYSVPMGFIHVRRQQLFTPMPYSRLTINAGMKTYEAAEVVVNNLRATPGVFDLTVEESAPAEVGGLDGFELLISYAMESGIRRRCLIYGVIVNDKYYAEAGLYALEDHYFNAALPDFLALVESIRVGD